MKKDRSVALVLAFSVSMFTTAWGANVGGLVQNAQGQSVAGVNVIAKDAQGKLIGQGTTSSSGVYEIKELQPGNYNFTLDPASSGFQGQTVASYVGPDGICLNWGVSTTAPAVASAQPGATCQLAAGYGTAEMVAAGAGVLGATGIGLAVGLGGGGDHNRKSPVSTAQ